MVKICLHVLILLAIISCSEEEDMASKLGKAMDTDDSIKDVHSPDTHADHQDSLTYLALGDSYTIGASVNENDRWPVQLVAAIRDIPMSINDPEIIAASGWTTGNLLGSLRSRDLNLKYDLVSLLIGVNNQYQGLDFNVFQEQFIELLAYSLAKAVNRNGVFVLSIPDYGVTPFGKSNQSAISEDIDKYNSWIEEICLEKKVKFYNITEISRWAENDQSLLAPDYLHPSGKMYAEWVKLVMADPPEIIAE